MLKLEVGKTYEDDEGALVKIIHQYASKERLFLGVRNTGVKNCEESECYNQNGFHTEYQNFTLVREAKPPIYRWFNLYESSPGYVYHKTKEEALNGRTPGQNHIAICKIELNTGTVTREDK